MAQRKKDYLIHGVRPADNVTCRIVQLVQIISEGLLVSESKMRKGHVFCQVIEGWDLLRPRDQYCWFPGLAIVLSPVVLKELPFKVEFFKHNKSIIEKKGNLQRQPNLMQVKRQIRTALSTTKHRTPCDFHYTHQIVFDGDVPARYIAGVIVMNTSIKEFEELKTLLDKMPHLWCIVHKPSTTPKNLETTIKKMKAGDFVKIF